MKCFAVSPGFGARRDRLRQPTSWPLVCGKLFVFRNNLTANTIVTMAPARGFTVRTDILTARTVR